jgi:hypothetical protein
MIIAGAQLLESREKRAGRLARFALITPARRPFGGRFMRDPRMSNAISNVRPMNMAESSRRMFLPTSENPSDVSNRAHGFQRVTDNQTKGAFK